VIAAVLAYPLYYLVRLSFQHYGLFQLVRHKGVPIGTANYASIFHDSVFWHTLFRTVAVTAVCVVLTVVLATLIALLLAELSSWVRLLQPPRLVRQSLQRLGRDHLPDRLGRDPVRRDHAVRGADPGLE
jgi:ABC-type spermidine/putrescine transport system permease subunit I